MVERLYNENENAFIYRVCSLKGIEGLESWDKVGEFLNEKLGYNYSSSKYRKVFQSAQIMEDARKELFQLHEAQMEELEQLKEEIRKERIKAQTVNLERNRIDRAEARQELWFEQIADVITTSVKPTFNPLPTKSVNDNIEWVQAIADIHYGAEFAVHTNEYSPKIAKDRFELLLENTINFCKENQLQHLTTVMLGDEIQGILRMSDIAINNTDVVKACVEVSDLIIEYLNQLSKYVAITFYDVAYANHSQIRYLGSKSNAFPFEDLGYFIGNYIKKGLEHNERITVILPKDGDTEVYFKVFDFDIIAEHGHLIDGKKKKQSFQNICMRDHKFYDYMLIGHYHNEDITPIGTNGLHNTQVLTCDSFVGTDPYGQQFGDSKSAVKMFGFHKDYGHIKTDTFILN